MKRSTIKLITSGAASLVFTLISCNKDIVLSDDSPYENQTQIALTKSGEPEFKVTLSDVEWLIESLYPEVGTYEIEAYPNNEDPIMYAVNFDDGWMIVSGDKRISPVLAYNDKDNIRLCGTDNPGLLFWLDVMTERIESIDQNDKESESHLVFWSSSPYLKKDSKSIETKAGNLWYRQLVSEYTSSYSVSNSSASVSVIWGQGSPWNYKTPTFYGSHSPTGCVAVALAQIFRYLHYSIGVPSGLYHSVGYNNSNVFYRGDLVANSTRWDDMAMDKFSGEGNTDYVGDLMLDIGYNACMTYSGSESYTSATSALNALQYYDLAGTLNTYSFSTVKQEILNNRPVFMFGYKYPNYTSGHAWVGDGYNEIGTITHRIYIWHEAYSGYYGEVFTSAQAQSTLEEGVILGEGVGYCEDINNPISDYIHMNWGYDGSDNGWYVYPEWDFGNHGSYHYSAGIIYNFHTVN